jgi:hypothetical protein
MVIKEVLEQRHLVVRSKSLEIEHLGLSREDKRQCFPAISVPEFRSSQGVRFGPNRVQAGSRKIVRLLNLEPNLLPECRTGPEPDQNLRFGSAVRSSNQSSEPNFGSPRRGGSGTKCQPLAGSPKREIPRAFWLVPLAGMG